MRRCHESRLLVDRLHPDRSNVANGTVGVTVAPELAATPGVVSECTGLRPSIGASDGGPRYRESAFIPSRAWRDCCSQESQFWSELVGRNRAVAVLPIATSMIDSFRRKVARLRGSSVQVGDPLSDRALSELQSLMVGEVDEWCTSYSVCNKSVIHHGFNTNPVGLVTVTHDGRGNRLGLHIDSWDGSRIDGRSKRTNRMCLNFGPGYRYFCFIDKPIWAIAEHLRDLPIRNVNALIQAFIANNPTCVVKRVRVDPGYAYIAPTEAIIHDGSSEGCEQPTVTYTVRGHFSLQQSCKRAWALT